MKLHLLFINLLFISFATIQIYSMQNSLESKVVRTVAFGASSAVAGVSLGIGSFGLFCAIEGGLSKGADLSHEFGTIISVPTMLVGSLATYPALLSTGIKDKTASKISGTIFGVSMLLNSLSHWINLQNSHCEKNLCIGMGVFTGIVGLTALGICHRK
jgi:hypothetical protein